MPQSQIIELPFPFSGINETEAKRRQPQGTTPDCLNVRPFDGIDNRRRGSQRGGLSKYLDDTVNGTNAIQEINTLVRKFDANTIVADTELFSQTFTQANGFLTEGTTWYRQALGSGSTLANGAVPLTLANGDTIGPKVASNAIDASAWTADRPAAGFTFSTLGQGTVYILACRFKIGESGTGRHSAVLGIIRATNPSSDVSSYIMAGVRSSNPGTGTLLRVLIHYGPGGADRLDGSDFETSFDHSAWHDMEVRVNGNLIRVYVDGVKRGEATTTRLNSQTRIGFILNYDSTGDPPLLDDFVVSGGRTPASFRSTEIIVVSGGGIYAGNLTDGLSQPTGGAAVLKMEGPVSSQALNQKMYFCDGLPEDYVVYDPAEDTVTGWGAAITAGGLPAAGSTSTSSDVSSITDADTVVTTDDLSSEISAGDFIEWSGSVSNDSVYYVSAISTVTIDVVPDITDTGDATGAIRRADVSCRYMTLYRGRMVLWGLETDLQNWFMSAVGDPNDWDYGPATTSQTQAIAGHNADAGKLGDVLNCCAPYSDDLMFMGGDHTLWIMRGDPAAGGVIDNISYQTGIVGPRAFAWDEEGNFYFQGAGQLWRIPAGTTSPESISRSRMDDTFATIDYITHEVRLVWDSEHQGLHILFMPTLQPSAGSEPTHIFWDRRTDSFWKDKYPAAIGPTVAHAYDADDPDDRAVLFGGWDSYIRYIRNEQPDDDGTAIASHVWFRPIVLSDMSRVRISEIRAILATGSGAVRLEVHASDTAENLIASGTARFTQTLTADRNRPIIKRAVGNAIGIKMVNDSADLITWAVESMIARVTPAGKHRQGVL